MAIARRVNVCLDENQEKLLQEVHNIGPLSMCSYSEILRMFFVQGATEWLKKKQKQADKQK